MLKIINLLETVEASSKNKERVEQSLDYLRNHNLQAMSNEVPDELLDWWVTEWNYEENGNGKSIENCENFKDTYGTIDHTDEPFEDDNEDYEYNEKDNDTDNEEDNIEIDEQSLSNYENLSVFGKVFMAVMFARQDKDPTYFVRTKETSPQAILHASELVCYVQLSRKANRQIPDFDIFDVQRYDEIMDKLCGK